MGNEQQNPFAFETPGSTQVASGQGVLGGINKKKIIDIIQIVVLITAVLVVMYLFFIIPTQVDGNSMIPNLHDNDILLTNRLIQIIGGPSLLKSYDYQRGDIVVFYRKDHPDLVKRIIGLPGDRVKIQKNSIYINDVELPETYIDKNVRPTEPGTFMAAGQEVIVPEDHYFALGDNRTNSIDSRSADIGFVKRQQLKGSPFIRIIHADENGKNPMLHIEFFKRPQYPGF